MTDDQASELKTELAAMDDRALVRFYEALEVDDPRVDVVAGEMERRGVDF